MTDRTVNGKPVEAEGTLVLAGGSHASFMVDSLTVEVSFDLTREAGAPVWSDVPGGVRVVFPDELPFGGCMRQDIHWAGATYQFHIWCSSAGDQAPRSHLVHYTVTR